MKEIHLDQVVEVTAVGYMKQVLLTAGDLNNPDTLVQIVTIEPGDAIANHYHKSSFEFYYVLQGKCRLTTNGQQYMLAPGTMLLIEPGDVHQLHNPGSELFKLLVFKTNAGSAGENTYWPD